MAIFIAIDSSPVVSSAARSSRRYPTAASRKPSLDGSMPHSSGMWRCSSMRASRVNPSWIGCLPATSSMAQLLSSFFSFFANFLFE